MIRRFDDNHDGKLQLTELPERMRERLGTADTNRDGVLSADEIAAHRTQREEQRFTRKDMNGDGAITADEVSPSRWQHLAAADQDKDGRVTLQEMEAAFANGTLRMPRHGFRPEPPTAPGTVTPTKS
jgi:Ca2+-binding EF-hand superfamily protein